ncbi:MAG TPA: bifunctional demethylmenaquinone methyltransferase/2-methoxy-6-polyprenyl-1,4-benzoquinol methylase UbiE [Bacteroidales bacterium]|mgnify:FL=1|nr:bifunctional demethylmenaquinone methyltransferase/2-methoxy-6-polyprenyl-1,4-benzoquinol methylase UbiE [Bacteroidales bacterium]
MVRLYRQQPAAIFTIFALSMEHRPKIEDHTNLTGTGSMFDSIAFRYDFLNHFLSFGIDRSWRKKAIREISLLNPHPSKILDVATGTADLAIAALKLSPDHITGIDISEKMLEAGRAKTRRLSPDEKITLLQGDSLKLEFSDEAFDVTMAAFGVRNFSDSLAGLSEMHRVLRKNGVIMILEFSKPSGKVFRHLYNLYFHKILPQIGRFFSKSHFAYSYLPDSVMKFPDNEQFITLLGKAGFTAVRQKRLTGGVASIYTGRKI